MTVRYLFVTHKWGDAVPGTGESVTIPHLVETFREWGHGQAAVFWTDETFHHHGETEKRLIETVTRTNPDVIVYTPIPAGHLEIQNISPEIMRAFEIKTVAVFFDLADRDARRLSEKYAVAADLCVNIDGSQEPIGRNFLSLWPARTKRLPQPKTIDISFLGARKNYRDRTAALDLLAAAQIPIVVSGGRAENNRSFDEYFDILDRSLVTLNFSKTVRGDSQIKARVFEALSSGCCLVEDRNAVTERYLEPGVDYLAWDNVSELPALLRRLLGDKDFAARIARNGAKKFASTYSASRFWDAIVERL